MLEMRRPSESTSGVSWQASVGWTMSGEKMEPEVR